MVFMITICVLNTRQYFYLPGATVPNLDLYMNLLSCK